jgi:putative toxin-antitoxin system antitoxin component (TIGR02293 family)
MIPDIARRLGGRRVLQRELRTELDLARAVQEGLPVAALGAVAEELQDVAPLGSIYSVIGSARTLQRKRAAGTRLSTDESDRLARLGHALVRAEQALGNPERARRWLAQPNRALGGATPLSLLAYDAGTRAVEQELGRIEHGVFS